VRRGLVGGDGRGTTFGTGARSAGFAHLDGRGRGLGDRRRRDFGRACLDGLERLGSLARAFARGRRSGLGRVGDRRLRGDFGRGVGLDRSLARRARLLDGGRRAFGRVLGRHIRGIGTHCSGPCFR
jgi:hypothetical protein